MIGGGNLAEFARTTHTRSGIIIPGARRHRIRIYSDPICAFHYAVHCLVSGLGRTDPSLPVEVSRRWLEETEAAPTLEARTRLMELPGVGRKIADCVLLFGAGRLEAFPIDTWVEKILTCAYQLEGFKQRQLQDFARIHFGAAAGYAQQYLFAAARAGYIPS